MTLKDESESTMPPVETALSEAIAAIQPQGTVEEVMEKLVKTSKGQVKNMVTNAETILSCDPLLRGAIRFNELTQRVDIVKPVDWERGKTGTALDDNDINNIHLYCERTYGFT